MNSWYSLNTPDTNLLFFYKEMIYLNFSDLVLLVFYIVFLFQKGIIHVRFFVCSCWLVFCIPKKKNPARNLLKAPANNVSPDGHCPQPPDYLWFATVFSILAWHCSHWQWWNDSRNDHVAQAMSHPACTLSLVILSLSPIGMSFTSLDFTWWCLMNRLALKKS